jgi:CRISPR/Cas system-associated exonuclease Cas4 (RecB family)
MFQQCPLRYYRQRILKDVKDKQSKEMLDGHRIHKLLEDRLKGSDLPLDFEKYEPLCKAVEKLASAGELHVEYEMVLTKDLKPTSWWGRDAWLRSKLDVLVIVGDTAVVMDWKTGKRSVDQFQLEMFAAQVFLQMPHINKVKTSLVWLKSLEQDVEEYERSDSHVLWEKVFTEIRAIENAEKSKEWVARPSALCNWCPCQSTCKFSK